MRAPPRDWHTILDGYGSKDFHHDEEDGTWTKQNQVTPGKRMLVWLSPQEIRTPFFLTRSCTLKILTTSNSEEEQKKIEKSGMEEARAQQKRKI